MKTRYLVTEALFHVSYLMQQFAPLSGEVKAIVRDKKGLDRQALDQVHGELASQKELTDAQMSMLEEAYKASLSLSERALIRLHGVPETHVLSLPNTQSVTDLHSIELLDGLERESFKSELCAGIFLDCLLKPRWLQIFENRIVNAHSAMLPHARGMHAIEQTAALGDIPRLMICAGASIHYIDHEVDMGQIIKTSSLVELWNLESIWEVKANSYLNAFRLLAEYMGNPKSFSFKDTVPPPYFQPGPEYKLKDFTPEVSARAEATFLAMRAMMQPSEPESSNARCSFR